MDEDGTSDLSDIISVDQFGIPEYRELIVSDLDGSKESDKKDSRLMISKIVNENFKSYAGIKQLGPFHKKFTAIIGPNGSGKSNVIDSMLFVFGYRANKIRSKKISVLIHSSENNQDIESCTVSVHFQKIIDEGPGDNEYRVVEGSQFVVSRTAFRDSSSFYKINNRKAHYREVETFLKNVGVDLVHNRFLILQGEVEQIAMMKPKSQNKNEDGMLEFLEDIIGSNRFKSPIETLSKRIEFLAELKTEKFNRVKTVEIEKNELEADKNEALEFLSIQNENIKNENLISHNKLFHCEKQMEEISVSKNGIIEELKEFDDKIEKIVSEKKAKANEYKEAIKKYNNLTKKHDNFKEQFSKFEEEDTRCLEDMKHCKIKSKKLDSSLQQEEKKLKEFLMIPEKQQKDVDDLKKKLEKLNKEKKLEQDNFNEVMSNFQDETKDLQTQKTKKEMELLDVQKDVNESKHKYQVTQTELDLFKSNQLKETNKLNDIRRNMERIQSTLQEKRITSEDLRIKLPDSLSTLEKCKKDLDKLNDAEHRKQEDAKQVKIKVEMARSSFQASQSQSKVLGYLMNLKKSGEISGIYGRLGDLGAIDAKYDVAISTACGFLDHIIVDCMDTAQKCIEALKTANAGKASFIGLDHMVKWKEHCNSKINTPENVPRLFDLIKVKNKDVMPAFYFALRNTLVSKDINEATRIAYGPTRFRVVTLGGQLIDLSGTMSGGGTRVIKGKMGSQLVEEVDHATLQNMDQELEKLTRELDGFKENKGKLQVSITNFQKTHRENNNLFQKLLNEIKSLEEQYENYKTQEKEQITIVKQSAPDDKKLSVLEKTVEKLKAAYEKVQKIASDMEDEIHEMHKQIVEVGGKELKSIETKMALLDTQIDQINNVIGKAIVAITTAQRNAKKSEAKVESLKQEVEENKEKMEQLDAEKQKIETDAHALLIFLNKAEEDMKNYESEVANVSDIIAKYEDDEQAIRTQIIKVTHRLEKIEQEEKDIAVQIEGVKNKISKLKLNVIEENDVLVLPFFKNQEELGHVDEKVLVVQIDIANEKLSNMKPNMAAIDEYKKKNELYLKRVDEMTRVSNLKDLQRKHYEDFCKRRFDEFMCGFAQVTSKLKEMYQLITLGGDAELELVDSLDPFSEGIVFSVRPPKKSWKNISNLSGGEKTLSSLALVFALHHYKPTPFYVMDEIDAALDFRNVSIVANYIKERTEGAQFIVISLRNNMFERCDRLVGIFKVNNCTSSVVINPCEIALKNKA